MEPTPTDILPINIPEHLRDQLTDLHSTLHSIEDGFALNLAFHRARTGSRLDIVVSI